VKLLREPLLHFLVAGAIVFAGYAWITRGQPRTSDVEPVRIGDGEVRWLIETWSNQRLRTPTPDELRGMVADLVNEELLAREARALGLDEDDTVVRRRLAQKLTFLIEDTSRLADPTEDDLRAFYEANAAQFQRPARVSFTQVYFNPDKRDDAVTDATSALAQLEGAGGSVRIEELGDRLLVDGDFNDVDEQSVSNLLGPDFAEAVFALTSGKWSGPIRSGFGLHLVSLTGKRAATLPPLEEVRAEVQAAWLRDRQELAAEEYLVRLREKYGVILDDSVKALLDGDANGALASR
jgi:hypothetical protein